MSGHRKYSASAAHRWIKCTASHKLEAAIPDVTSKYAAEGTRAHAFASYLLTGGTLEPGEQIAYEDNGKQIDTVVDAETLESIAPYVDFVNDMIAKGAIDLRVEFSADVIPDELGGTADAVFLRRDTLHVCDLKYGRGVVVEAKENIQLICYALACLPYYPTAKQICLNIIQPRAQGETIKQWRLSVKALEDYRITLKEAIIDINCDDTKFARGEHCRFCKIHANCPSCLELIDDRKLANAAYVLEHIEEIRALCKAVETDAETRLRNGEKIQGWKLVQQTPRAKWKADAIEALIGLEGLTRIELIGITEARKIDPDAVERWTVKESSGAVMVRTADKRPEISSGEMLDDLTTEE